MNGTHSPLTFGVWALQKWPSLSLSLSRLRPLPFTESRLHTTHGADLPWHGMAGACRRACHKGKKSWG